MDEAELKKIIKKRTRAKRALTQRVPSPNSEKGTLKVLFVLHAKQQKPKYPPLQEKICVEATASLWTDEEDSLKDFLKKLIRTACMEIAIIKSGCLRSFVQRCGSLKKSENLNWVCVCVCV